MPDLYQLFLLQWSCLMPDEGLVEWSSPLHNSMHWLHAEGTRTLHSVLLCLKQACLVILPIFIESQMWTHTSSSSSLYS